MSSNQEKFSILFLVLCLIASYLHYRLFADYFRDLRNDEFRGLLYGSLLCSASILGGGYFLRTPQKSWLTALSGGFGIVTALLFGGIYVYLSNYENQAFLIKKSYVQNRYEYRHNDLRNDFFDPNIGPLLLEDMSFIQALSRTMSPDNLEYQWLRTSSLQSTTTNMLYPKLAWLLLATYQQKNIKLETLLNSREGRSLSVALLFAEFQCENAYKDLIEESAPSSVLRERTWTTIPVGIKQYLEAKPTKFLRAGVLDRQQTEQIIRSLISQLSSLSELETEILILSLVSFPMNINSTDFQKIIEHWAGLKPLYQKDLLALAKIRNDLQNNLLKNHKPLSEVGIRVVGKTKLEECNSKPFQQLLVSSGFVPVEGNDIEFDCSKKVTLLRKDSMPLMQTQSYQETVRVRKENPLDNSKIKYEQKTVQKYRQQEIGVQDTSTFKRELQIRYRFSKQVIFSDVFEVNYELAHQYWKPEEKQYSVEVGVRKETWVFGLPLSMILSL